MVPFSPKELNELVKSRRSVYPKMYNDKPVDDDIINQILENANWAPNHKNTEPWRFVVFTGNGLKRLAEFQARLYKETSHSTGNFDEIKYQKLLTQPLRASHVIAIGMNRSSAESVPEVEEIIAVGCAIQNMYLTATAYEVGCYINTGGITYIEEAKKFFGLDSKDTLIGFMYLGNIENRPPPGIRKSVQQKVRWEK